MVSRPCRLFSLNWFCVANGSVCVATGSEQVKWESRNGQSDSRNGDGVVFGETYILGSDYIDSILFWKAVNRGLGGRVLRGPPTDDGEEM